MKIVWTLRAKKSLKEVLEYPLDYDIGTANRIYERISEKANLLADVPFLGAQYEMDVRRLPLGDLPYSIYYRVKCQEIQILRVRHDMRLLPKDFH